MDDHTVIQVENLTKRYRDKVAVADIGFRVARGEIFGLLGPNGAGKTTAVECLQGLRRRSGGSVTVLGLDPDRQARALRRRIGSQLQSSALPERLRVQEAIGVFGKQRGQPVDLETILADWDLAGVRQQAFASLSGGQQQRVFLALALLGDPDVLFLDELTTGLDPTARRATWGLIRQVRDRGATVVLVTHLMEEAEALCDRIAVVDQGRVTALGTPGDLSASHGGPIRITFTDERLDPSTLLHIPGVQSVTAEAGKVTVQAESAAAVPVAAALADVGLRPNDFRTHYPSLEDVFLSLTGHRLSERGPQ